MVNSNHLKNRGHQAWQEFSQLVDLIYSMCPDHKRLFTPLQPMSAFFQDEFPCKELSFADIIITLSMGELAGEEGTKV